MTDVVFHPAAEREFIEAARFYEECAPGLGADFIRQIERTLVQIAANPDSGSVSAKTIRRRLVRRFPFAVLYQSRPKAIFVLAIAHLRRRPGYWKSRTKSDSEE